MAAPRVIVIGGGVGGLTAAHELIDRGFAVDVFEARPDFGGKARTQPVLGTGTAGRKDLPGEHGFRFYPRFYRHIIDQMGKIPSGAGSVRDQLRPTSEAAFAMIDNETWFRFSRKRLDSPYSILESLEVFFKDLDFADNDIAIFTAKVLQFATACDARRLAEYEHMSWWQFLEADRCSDKFQRQLRGIPRMMVAMDSQRGSARTIGIITLQIIRDFGFIGAQNDRTMSGPTSEKWIEPWTSYLAGKGVVLHAGRRALGLEVAGGRIAGVRMADGDTVTGDQYVLAVPLDVAMTLVTPAMGVLDPTLDTLRVQDADHLAKWMVGIQYYLFEDVPLVRGHLFFPDSPWALTAISQPQFWRDLGIFRRTYGDGSVGGLISVDISEWETPGRFIRKIAKDCTREEVAEEVWEQLKAALNGAGEGGTILSDELLHSWHLDDDLDYGAGLPPINSSRLLVHPPGSWSVRPEAATAIPNLALASDYVRTHTNIASMEGACEAGRRAANAIIDRTGATAPRSEVWPLEEPSFRRLKALDARRFAAGRPHLFETMGIDRGVRAIETLRKLEDLVGLGALDDYFDQFKATRGLRRLLKRFGIQ